MKQIFRDLIKCKQVIFHIKDDLILSSNNKDVIKDVLKEI